MFNIVFRDKYKLITSRLYRTLLQIEIPADLREIYRLFLGARADSIVVSEQHQEKRVVRHRCGGAFIALALAFRKCVGSPMKVHVDLHIELAVALEFNITCQEFSCSPRKTLPSMRLVKYVSNMNQSLLFSV